MNLDEEDAVMPAPPPPLHFRSQFGPYGQSLEAAGAMTPMLAPGDRVGGPPPRRPRRVWRALIAVSATGLGAWLAIERRGDVEAIVTQASAILIDLQPRRHSPVASPPPQEQVVRSDPPPLTDRDVATAPTAEVFGAQAPPGAERAAPQPDAPALDKSAETSPPSERLAAIVTDPADTLQQTALAAGLHPELSRTLLAQLTPEDFRNAAFAVNALLKGEKSAAPLVWPRQRASHRAQFKIRWVDGAPVECRRYIVQIAKDGWETTARPMERCSAAQAFKPS